MLRFLLVVTAFVVVSISPLLITSLWNAVPPDGDAKRVLKPCFYGIFRR